MDYTLSTTNVTDTSFDVVITANVATTGTRILALKVEDASAPGTGTNFMLTDTGMAQGGTKTFTVENGSGITINSGTEYNVSLEVGGTAVADSITVTTKSTGYDTPRTATQEQWEDLADRVNSRPIIGTVVSQPTAVAYVATANIVNGAVTPAKLDMASLVDVFYPVGCYFETSDTTFDPNVSWGGTWVEDSAGKVLVSKDAGTFANVGDTGGVERTNHAFYRQALNSGNFQDAGQTWINDVIGRVNTWLQQSGSSSLQLDSAVKAFGGSVGTNSGTNTEVGFFKYTATTLQPYVVIKRWHRTA